jgi:hypothetical protein
MKEGYLQLKISKLNDKCTEIDQMISMEKSKIKILEERVGGFKELIKKLRDLDEFKERILKQIKIDNKELLLENIKSISDNMSDNIDFLIKNKINEIESILNYMRTRKKEIDRQTKLISQMNDKINYLLKHNDYLMMKLVNKGFLSDREVTELHNRSSKKTD